MNLYAVAIVLPNELSVQLDSLRKKYKSYVNYSIVPHITLIQPFSPDIDTTVISEKLKTIVNKTRPFDLMVKGIEYFEGQNNVVYAGIENKDPLIALHSNIIHSLGEIIKDEYQSKHILDRYIPHITIGEQIPDDILSKDKEQLSKIEIKYDCEITSFSLFSGTEDRVWRPAEVFLLSG